MFFKEAITINELKREIDIGNEERSTSVSSQLRKFDYENGTLEFISHSSGSKDSWTQKIVLVDWPVLRELFEEEAGITKEPEDEPEEEPEESDFITDTKKPAPKPTPKPVPKPVPEPTPVKPSPSAPVPSRTAPTPSPAPRAPAPQPPAGQPTVSPPGSPQAPKQAPTPAPAPSGPGFKPLKTLQPSKTMKTLKPMKSSSLKITGAPSWQQVVDVLGDQIMNSDVKVSCSCPAYQYWGAHYIFDQLDVGLPPPETRYPSVRNPNLDNYSGGCKHIVSVFRKFFQ